ncbi:MAG: hypothetical protein QOC73_2187 [Actinomycetota bacterium]|nr:hypothetical protein [Actinomycetota bacterium]
MPVVRAELRVEFSVVAVVAVTVVLVTTARATLVAGAVTLVACICGQFLLYPQGFSGFPHFVLGFGKCRRERLA